MGKGKKPVVINLGCNRHAVDGMINVDYFAFPGVDKVMDLEGPWDFPDNYADKIIAVDLVEHLHDRIHTMNEAWRVLKPGGIFEIVVPSSEGRGGDQDPTHVSAWNINSFFYYAVFKENGSWVSHPWRLLYAPHMIKAAFDVEPRQHDPDPMGIIYVTAQCRAVKDPIFTPDGLPEASLMPEPLAD